jgi:uncharacterized protein YcfL
LILKNILFLFVIILVGCQTNEAKNTTFGEEHPEISVILNDEQLITNTEVYCWNDCGHMEATNVTELTEGMEAISVSSETKVEVSVNSSEEPTTIGYYKQQKSDLIEKTIHNNTFEIQGQKGIQHYLIIVEWYDRDGKDLLGRAATPFVVEVN